MKNEDERETEPSIMAARPSSPADDSMRRFGRAGYEAYARFTGGKTFDGRPMPTWDDLTERIKDAWASAASGIIVEQSRDHTP